MVERREDLGTWESYDDVNRKIREWSERGATANSNPLEQAIRVGLGNFPLSAGGRIISPDRVIKLLDKLRETGLPLGDYMSLSEEQRWSYLQSTKEKLKRTAHEHFPGLLREIDVECADDYLSH